MTLYAVSKRILDLTASLLALILAAPLLLLLIVLIRIDSKGPAIFKQERAGKNGKPFVFYKFRTMKTDANPFGPSPKSDKDSRLTRIGRLLREYSLDELPQLVNILTGRMSLVGPRPLYVSQIAEWNDRQTKRLLVKPGLTGLAQISGRGELTREQKLDLDVEYVETAGFWLDCKIILATIGHVFMRRNIYEKQYSETEHTRGRTEQQDPN